MKQKLAGRKGITLIALVITIIVLLILAGVSIAMLTGDNGILTQAKEAKEETRGGEVQEARDLWKSNKASDKIAGTSTAQTLDELLSDLKKQKQLTDEEVETIKETGKVTIGSRTIIFGTSEMTLVEMFKKAETEGCKNLDGSCKNEEHLHIGDYVEYKNPTSGAYTVTAEKSGMSQNQTYDVAKNQLNWRVLGIDEETGGLKLIAGSPMKLNDIAGKYNPYLHLGGAKAYEYGPNEMDKVGALYKNEYAQTARSVKMEDINQVLGIKTEEDIKEKNALPIMMNTTHYGENYGPIEGHYTPSGWINGKQTTTVQGKTNAYAFIIESEGMPPEASNIAINMENIRAKAMLFDNVETGQGKNYWLASRGVYAYPANTNAFFCLGGVGDGNGMMGAGSIVYIFNSNGNGNGYGFAVRPVVSLKSEITKNEVPKIADKTEENWNYER